MRVLIVEDDPVVALSFRFAMESAGLTVCGTAATEEEALSALHRECPDFLTVDVRLAGGGDGARVAEVAWDRYGIRSLLITGDAVAVDARRAARLHLLGCLPKPVGFLGLRAALDGIRERMQGLPVPAGSREERGPRLVLGALPQA